MKMEVLFSEILEDVKLNGTETERTIIFCQTRNQCALLWKMFKLNLGDKFYSDIDQKPTARMIEMYRDGSPDLVKAHVLGEIRKQISCLCILIVTVAFGMGSDCIGVHRIIHFGPSKTFEAYLQECGRAGRDGKESQCYLLYNGLLASHCQTDMKEYLPSDTCKRKLIAAKFPGEHKVGINLCRCCSTCLRNCKCDPKRFPEHLAFSKTPTRALIPAETRDVSQQKVNELKTKLAELKTNFWLSLATKTSVSFPNLSFEFTDFHICQVLSHCHKLFTVDDIISFVEVWRTYHAHNILQALNDVFHDIDETELDATSTNLSVLSIEDETDETWMQVRDDSNLDLFDDSDNMLHLDAAMEELDKSENLDRSITANIDFETIKPVLEDEILMDT